jgi:hypothetical protein
MATLVTPTNLQKMEFDVTTAEGPSRVTIVTGAMPITVAAFNGATEKGSFKALLDPSLTPGLFRRATATASFGHILSMGNTTPLTNVWVIEDAQATLDDETGRVQLVVDVTVRAGGTNTTAQVNSLMFQVTTLARVLANSGEQ